MKEKKEFTMYNDDLVVSALWDRMTDELCHLICDPEDDHTLAGFESFEQLHEEVLDCNIDDLVVGSYWACRKDITEPFGPGNLKIMFIADESKPAGLTEPAIQLTGSSRFYPIKCEGAPEQEIEGECCPECAA